MLLTVTDSIRHFTYGYGTLKFLNYLTDSVNIFLKPSYYMCYFILGSHRNFTYLMYVFLILLRFWYHLIQATLLDNT
jgi:hypothetical protein